MRIVVILDNFIITENKIQCKHCQDANEWDEVEIILDMKVRFIARENILEQCRPTEIISPQIIAVCSRCNKTENLEGKIQIIHDVEFWDIMWKTKENKR